MVLHKLKGTRRTTTTTTKGGAVGGSLTPTTSTKPPPQEEAVAKKKKKKRGGGLLLQQQQQQHQRQPPSIFLPSTTHGAAAALQQQQQQQQQQPQHQQHYYYYDDDDDDNNKQHRRRRRRRKDKGILLLPSAFSSSSMTMKIQMMSPTTAVGRLFYISCAIAFMIVMVSYNRSSSSNDDGTTSSTGVGGSFFFVLPSWMMNQQQDTNSRSSEGIGEQQVNDTNIARKILKASMNSSSWLRWRKYTTLNNADTKTRNGRRTGRRPIVYTCGYNMTLMAKNLFPEYKHRHLTYESITTNRDILVYGMHGMPNNDCPVSQDVTQSLNLKAKLYVNGESHDNMKVESDNNNNNNVYRIGPYEDTSTTMLGLLGAMNLFNRPDETELIKHMLYRYNEKLRSANTGEYYMLYPNSKCHPHRENAIRELSNIGIVHAPFQCDGGSSSSSTILTTTTSDNNEFERQQSQEERSQQQQQQRILKIDVTEDRLLTSVIEKRNFVRRLGRKYRFYFCMENTDKYGYLTEKIINAFVSGAIPIYYGTRKRDVYEVFNSKAFIYYDIDNPTIALEQVKYLESNRTAYKEMQHQPIFKNGHDINTTIHTVIKNYFSYNDEFASGYLKYRIRNMMMID